MDKKNGTISIKFTLREQKFGDKRYEILQLFLSALEKKSIHHISIEEICKKAESTTLGG